jgi:hypothetical protein
MPKYSLSGLRGKADLRAYMRRAVALLLFLAALHGPGHADTGEYPHHPVNFSLFYPISTNQDPEVSTNFRLNLIYSDIGAVRGVDISGIVGRVRREMIGLQVNGIYSHIGGEFTGVGVSGFANYVKSDVRGVQYAGLVNFVRGDFAGFQFANLFNYVEGAMVGAQATALFNLNDDDVKYFQAATMANAVAGDFTGVQAAGGLNYVNEAMVGGQLALCNFAKYMNGVQIGLGNIAGTASGVQVGFVNYAVNLDGVPIGVINISGEGGGDWVTFGSNLAAISTGVRTVHRRFYSFFAIGVGDLQDKRNDTAFLSWNYGYAIPVVDRWSIGVDVGYVHIMPTPSSDPDVNGKAHFAIQGRAIAEVRFSEKVAIFGGGGVSQRYTEFSSDASSSTDPLVVLGISLY